jgi:hypothetical protein
MLEHIYYNRSHEYQIKHTRRDCFQVLRIHTHYIAWEGVLWWNGSMFVVNVYPMTHFYKRQAVDWIEKGCPTTYPHFVLVWAPGDEAGKVSAQQELFSVPKERMLLGHPWR